MGWKTSANALIFPFGKVIMTDHAVQIRSMEQLGELVRATRRENGTDQATTAGVVGVGVRFLGDLERGKPNLRIGLVLRVLERLGLEVWVAPRGGGRALP